MVEEVKQLLHDSFQAMIQYVPQLVNALLTLIIGWLIAKLVQWIVFKLSHAFGIDRLAQRSGVHRFLEKRGIRKGFSGIIASISFWAIILIVLVNFFNHLGFEIVSDLLNQLILFIPNVLIACVLIIIGFYLAEFVSSLVVGSLEESNFENPELIGRLVFYCIGFFTVAIALTQIGIGEVIISNVVSIFFGSIGLAFAISFGLAGRKWADKMIRNFFSLRSTESKEE